MAVSTLYFYQAALKAGPGNEIRSYQHDGYRNCNCPLHDHVLRSRKILCQGIGTCINPHDTRDAFYWGRYVDW